MISRIMRSALEKRGSKFRVVALIGPRQSGKTTLAKNIAFPNHTYVSLESFKTRRLAQEDPELFLKSLENEHGIIIDEFQYAPDLLSYIQLIVDEHPRPGYFILTGSQNFLMNKHISQSLAGRVTILRLMPLSIEELKNADYLPSTPEELMYKGFYPEIYDKDMDPTEWYDGYTQTYINRDVKQLIKPGNIKQFEKFLELCAGRVGQLLNISSIARDAAVSVNTAREWLSILEASHL